MKREMPGLDPASGQQKKKLSDWLQKREPHFNGTQWQAGMMPLLSMHDTQETPEARNAPDGGLKLRLGTVQKTGEPIFWRPRSAGEMNACVLGMPGTGKTQLIKSLITQLHRCRSRDPECAAPEGILILDYRGNYNETKPEFLEATGAKVLKHQKLALNPLSLAALERKPQLPVHTAMNFADAMAFSYGLDPIQKSTLVQSVMSAYARCGITSDPATWDKKAPTFEDVRDEYIARPSSQHNDSLDTILETLSAYEMFQTDDQSVDILRELVEGVVVVDLSGCTENLKHMAVAMILERLCAWLDGSAPVNLLVLLDEADEILHRELPVLTELITEGGTRGISVMLCTHQPERLCTWDEKLREHINLWAVHNAQELKKSEVEFIFRRTAHDPMTEQLLQGIRRLGKHHSVMRIDAGEPVFAEELPFFEISMDREESYLKESASEPEVVPGGGMPLLDAEHLDVYEVTEASGMPLLEIFAEPKE